MRFIVLIALFGIVAARCPFNNRRCFNQMLQGMQNNQDTFGQQYEDDENEDDDQTQQQSYQCQVYGQCEDDENQDQDQDEDGQSQWAMPTSQQQQQRGQQQQCRPNYQLLQQLEQPNSQLAAKLYKQAKQENDDKNTVVSPAAVQLTLAALQKGARGNTKAQIRRAQCPGLTQQQCQQAHAAMIRSLKATQNVQQTQTPGRQSGQQSAKINVPTTIILNQQTPAQRQFAQTVQQCLGGQVKQCSFKRNPQQCRQQINRLISAKTNQKLQTAVPQQAITQNTKMVAVSALQLNAKWGQQFRQQQTTKQGRFYPLGSQQPKRTQVIQSQGQFNYHEDDQVQVVGIPTQQQELTLYIIVPKEKDGLTQVEKQQIQNGQQLRQLLDNTDQQTQYLQVQLPTFQAKHKLDARRTLQQQGVQDAFDCDAADFSGITGIQQQLQQQQSEQPHLNKLIHQATIKVSAQGISSANTGNQGSIQEQIQAQQQQRQQQNQQQQNEDDYENYQQNQYGQSNQVKANHAFAFVIKHNPSNQILAVGRVVDPTQTPQGQQQQGQNQNEDDGITDQE